MTKDEILRLIDDELSHSRARHERAGLTKWALWVGLGSLLWILIGLLEKRDGGLMLYATTSKTVVFVVLVLSLSITLSGMLYKLLWPRNGHNFKLVNLSLFQGEMPRYFLELTFILFLFVKLEIPSISFSLFAYGYIGLLMTTPIFVYLLPLFPIKKELNAKLMGIEYVVLFHILCWSLLLFGALHFGFSGLLRFWGSQYSPPKSFWSNTGAVFVLAGGAP